MAEPLHFTCPACQCRNTTVRRANKRNGKWKRRRICGNCNFDFWTIERLYGPERFDCVYIPISRNTSEYMRRAETFRKLKEAAGLFAEMRGDSIVVSRLLCALESARRKAGIGGD